MSHGIHGKHGPAPPPTLYFPAPSTANDLKKSWGWEGNIDSGLSGVSVFSVDSVAMQ